MPDAAKNERLPMDSIKPSTQYERRREQILEAAAGLINLRGASGMTMRDVGQAVNLTSATLTYYFKNKENLAEAVFDRRLDSLERTVSEAEKGATPYERTEILLGLEIERLGNVFTQRAAPLAALPVPTQDGEFLAVHKRIRRLFDRIHGLVSSDSSDALGVGRARSYMLIGLVFYMHTWLAQYSVDDFPRIQQRIMSLLVTGLAGPDFRWNPQVFDIDAPDGSNLGDRARAEFLRAATRLLNVNGYLGTSVDSIAEELNVTKGSFYHHLSSKDELVRECFSANFQRVGRAIAMARRAGGSHLQQTSSAIATLLDLQFGHDWPLLRSTAQASLPLALREEVAIGSMRTALSFAGNLSDGIAEGSVRPVDPLIASHVVNSTLYSAIGLQGWASRMPKARAIEIYASTLMFGIFDPEVVPRLDGLATATS
jgi:AcrR family transcriptional regulator